MRSSEKSILFAGGFVRTALLWVLAWGTLGGLFIYKAIPRPETGDVVPIAARLTPRALLVDNHSQRTKNIEEIQVGDYVLANDPEDPGPVKPHKVIGLPRNYTLHVVHLEIAGRDGGTGEVRTTREHPFFTKDRGWINAKELRVGDRLQDPDGAAATVLEVHIEDFHADTYNLTVEGVHTFYVRAGAATVLVHNSDPPIQGSGGTNTVYRIPGEQLTTGLPYIGKTGRFPARMGDADHIAKTVSGKAPIPEQIATSLTADEAAGVEAIRIQEIGLDYLTNRINGRDLSLLKNQGIKAAGERVLGNPCP